MSTGNLVDIQPSELKFPFELKKQSSCSMQLTNKTDQYVAFKVKTTNPKKYCVRPNNGILPPGSSSGVTVTMQVPKEVPPDLQCKDKFLIQSVVAPNAATVKELTPEMFNKEAGKVVEEFKLRVIYVPTDPPSPVPEGSEEGSSPRASLIEDGNQSASLPNAVTRSLGEPSLKSSPAEAWSLMSKLTEEKASAIQQNQKLHQELICGASTEYGIQGSFVVSTTYWLTLVVRCVVAGLLLKLVKENGKVLMLMVWELMRKEISKNRGRGFSLMFVAIVGLLGLLIGYLLKRT